MFMVCLGFVCVLWVCWTIQIRIPEGRLFKLLRDKGFKSYCSNISRKLVSTTVSQTEACKLLIFSDKKYRLWIKNID